MSRPENAGAVGFELALVIATFESKVMLRNIA
jgi:hypothetical protein